MKETATGAEDLRVAAMLEFSFDIEIDAQGVPELKAPDKGKPGYPQITWICCNTNDAFDAWIDRWHAHSKHGTADATEEGAR